MKITKRLRGKYRITLTEDELADLSGFLEDLTDEKAGMWSTAMDQARLHGIAREVPAVYTGNDEPDVGECASCGRHTMCSASMYALNEDGPVRIGAWSLCAACKYSPYQEGQHA